MKGGAGNRPNVNNLSRFATINRLDSDYHRAGMDSVLREVIHS